MSTSPYCVGGTVALGQPYVLRTADQEARKALRNRRYVLLCAPRQQGKSSLLARLAEDLQATPGCRVCKLDLQAFRERSEDAWYEDLLAGLRPAVHFMLGESAFDALPRTYAGFRDLLATLERALEDQSLFLDILVDEVGCCPTQWGPQFYAAIRAHHERTAPRPPRRINFLFAGAFVPSQMIPSRTSPFNVAQAIPLLDFSEAEVQQLVRHGPWPPDLQADLAQRIHGWTGGQPYLTQWFCERLVLNPEACAPEAIDAAAQGFLEQDRTHLRGLRSRVEQDAPALECVRAIAAKGSAPLTTSGLFDRLELVFGLVKSAGGCWRIRNRVYLEAIRGWSAAPAHPADAPPAAAGTDPVEAADSRDGYRIENLPQVFVSYSHENRRLEDGRQLQPLHKFEVFWKPLEAGGVATLWIDHQRVLAGRFEPQIRRAIRSARVAILFVSPEYLASTFVAEVEIPEIVAAAARETPLQVVVVELAHSNLKHTPLKDFHDFNQNAPLRALASVNSLELKLQELCDTVVKTLAASP